ncbi:MAG: hypothetical protein R3F65_16265 [bacterium]
MVHSIANASYGRFASLDRAQFHHKQFEKTFDSMAHSFVYWTQALLSRELLAPNVPCSSASPTPSRRTSPMASA